MIPLSENSHRKAVLIVTYIDFWRGGAGHRTRLSAIINYLNAKADLTVVYIGPCLPGDDMLLKNSFAYVNLHFLEKDKSLTINAYLLKFANYLRNKKFDVALLEYIEMYQLLDLIPASTTTILDTHDIFSDKIASFRQSGLDYDGMMVSFDEEIRIYEKFDYTILINKKDFDKVSDRMSAHKLLLIPHPVFSEKNAIRAEVKVIAFIASAYPPNVIAINWFIDKVWPQINRTGLILKVYGHVAKDVGKRIFMPEDNIHLEGYIKDTKTAYMNADIIINPVKSGAGLKIKNIEALGYGIPLVTTSHGCSGIEGAIDKALIRADTSSEFAAAVLSLVNDRQLRDRISDAAFAYAQNEFSELACFQPFDRFLN